MRGIRPPPENLSEELGGSSAPSLDAISGGEAAFILASPAERPIHLEASRFRSHNHAVRYRGFPSSLHHKVPEWVQIGALFHIRIAIDRRKEQPPLTAPSLAPFLLDSARFYEIKTRWHITLFLLMPDHLHGILSFAPDDSMSRVIGDWKHFQTTAHDVAWQDGYFDHRLRDDERGEQLSAKINYIRQNPVVAGLCAKAEAWPWVIEHFE